MRILGRLRTIALLSNLLLILAAADLKGAENNPQAVRIKIDTILASNQNDDFDSRLKPIEKQLKKSLKYRSYRLLKEESQNVPPQGNGTFDIPGGRTLIASPQDVNSKQVALKVRFQGGEKPLLDTILKLENKTNFIFAGPRHENGILVLVIWATVQ